LLKYASVKNWSAFERGIMFWTIKEEDGTFRIADQKNNLMGPGGTTRSKQSLFLWDRQSTM
jgi:hypothetical protein